MDLCNEVPNVLRLNYGTLTQRIVNIVVQLFMGSCIQRVPSHGMLRAGSFSFSHVVALGCL